MVSLAYLITLLSVLVAVSRADEVTGTKGAEVDAKWYGNYYGSYSYSNMISWSGSYFNTFNLNPWINTWGNMYGPCFGGAAFPFGYSRFFAKATEAEAHSVSRRATRLDAEHLFRRESNEPDSVSCLSDKGASELFSKSECAKAAETLHREKAHSATSGNCRLSLFTEKDKVFAKDLPEKTLQDAVQSILKTCGQKSQSPGQKSHIDDKQAIMILSKA
ncbi:hypothetical protein PGTUg99_018754 [Puccinia graminis f. sp. tritici]|uniref:Uncharacterized protein n=1 Tax=Puccinia graminis f. sp. tritici TaxID=56615 RepID=A0A5B0RMD6_PUCGR|nr:hypothetical protein PGTUg99_018754 [Puccinia graminis f. sp. tritici]